MHPFHLLKILKITHEKILCFSQSYIHKFPCSQQLHIHVSQILCRFCGQEKVPSQPSIKYTSYENQLRPTLTTDQQSPKQKTNRLQNGFHCHFAGDSKDMVEKLKLLDTGMFIHVGGLSLTACQMLTKLLPHSHLLNRRGRESKVEKLLA